MRSLVIVVALTRVAAAEEPVPEAYPVELVARPLLLPPGGVEGGAALETFVVDASGSGEARGTFGLIPRVRAGVGPAEVEAAVAMHLGSFEPEGVSEPDYDTLQYAFLAGRYGVTPQISVGAEGTFAEDRAGGRLRLTSKQRFGAGGGLELTLGVGMDRTAYPGFIPGEMELVDLDKVVEGGLRVQAQMAPQVAVEGRAALRYRDRDSNNEFGVDSSTFGQDYGVRLLGAVTPQVDLIAGFDILLSDGQATAKTFTIAVMVRRVP